MLWAQAPIDIDALSAPKIKKIQRIASVLKGGIWDEILPNLRYVPQFTYISLFKGSDSINSVGRQRYITVTGDYLLNTEVTNKMYRYFLADSTDDKYKPQFGKDTILQTAALFSHFTATEKKKKYTVADYTALDDYPVVGISFESAVAFCKWLTGKSKQAFIATTDSAVLLNFHLPTDAEFTKAAIMNTWYYNNNYPSFDDMLQRKLFPGNGRVQVNYGEGTDSTGNTLRTSDADGYLFTNPVKKFPAGYLGLYGMEGNAAEWALDIFRLNEDANFVRRRADVRVRIPEEGKERVVKGGSWRDGNFYMQPPVRQKMDPQQTSERIGFRLVMTDYNR
ncbi:C-type lectin protein [Russula earlei]|uniref:C-type lectin protein n=1 Tax=Russula earlei TaxID=71964 RepID=A0ACC0TQT7_9AGAM|nr:C-type lectin protein [Russula earlei]